MVELHGGEDFSLHGRQEAGRKELKTFRIMPLVTYLLPPNRPHLLGTKRSTHEL